MALTLLLFGRVAKNTFQVANKTEVNMKVVLPLLTGAELEADRSKNVLRLFCHFQAENQIGSHSKSTKIREHANANLLFQMSPPSMKHSH